MKLNKQYSVFFLHITFFFTVFLFPSWAYSKALTLILDWLPNPNHAVIFIAKEAGFFKKEGLRVTIIVPANPDDGPKLVTAGHADLAVTYEPQLALLLAKGFPLFQVATLIDHPLNCLIVRQESSIKNLSDLKNKRVAYASQAEGGWMLETLLKRVHLTLQDVQLINVQYNLVQALLGRHVDALINVMRNVEPLQLESAGQAVRVFPVEMGTIPSYDELIVIANKNRRRDPRIPKFLRALKEATSYLIKNPERGWKLFVKNQPILDNRLNHEIWKATLAYIARNPMRFDPQRRQRFNQFFIKYYLSPH